MITSQQIRSQFIEFFVERHGHVFVPSSPVVPHDDPSLLFTNAGMNQFKPIFLGLEKRDYTRVANTQKCIRAGGKHNDLDDVGRSRRHHTFFEMLGNWSFGDYFKQGAIEMAWELLTKVWGLDPSRLHVSCYEGDEKGGVPRDTEAADIWKKVAGLPDDHIHFFGKDNFWEMGETGPCGPCTEIYIDRTPDKTGGPEVNGSDPRVMEIWNLVFIQYNRDATGRLSVLPAQHVDTGMGFERISQVLQGVNDNFAIDLWQPIFGAISELSGLKYAGKFPAGNKPDPQAEAADAQLRHDIAFRVVADHLRCLTFALTDGAVPSNEGRGYVLRRILRRAVRFGRQQLELRGAFLHKLAPVVVETMGDAFPELRQQASRVASLIEQEEVSFGRTLDRGIKLFDEAAMAGRIDARDAFKLHDTYGFPIDLTRIMAEERGLAIDVAGYEALMEQARELARSGGATEKSKVAEMSPDALAQLRVAGASATDDAPKYDGKPIEARVLAIWDGSDLDVSPASATEPDQELAVILDRTPFYSEMGGQVGDAGTLRSTAGAQFDVSTTRKAGEYVLHIGRLRGGTLRVHDTVLASVDADRQQIEQNHTSTHLANWALREVLGDGVQQKGSLVDPQKLRFDFSHDKAMSEAEVERVETLVRGKIEAKLPVYAEEAPQEQALKIHGLRAVFGEKYPPRVRVVSIGAPVSELLADPTNARWRGYSIEFCGGTHLRDSSQAGEFAIVAEESVSKGIRRLTALTGDAAQSAARESDRLDALLATASQAPEAQLPQHIASINEVLASGVLPLRAKRKAQAKVSELQAKHKAWEKKNASAGTKLDVSAVSSKLLETAEPIGPGKLVVDAVEGADDETLRAVIDSLKKKAPSHAILLASSDGSKISFISVVSDDVIASGLKAGDWVKEAAKIAGGSGGGRPNMAQAGGKDPSKLADALTAARTFAKSRVKA